MTLVARTQVKKSLADAYAWMEEQVKHEAAEASKSPKPFLDSSAM